MLAKTNLTKHTLAKDLQNVGPAATQNLVVKFDGEICGGVLVENVSDDFPQQKKLENLLPNFAGSSPPISPQTSPASLWNLLVLKNGLLVILYVPACFGNGPEEYIWLVFGCLDIAPTSCHLISDWGLHGYSGG